MNPYDVDGRAGTHQRQRCGWTGTGDAADQDSLDGLVHMDPEKCDARLFLVPCITAEGTSQAASDGNREPFRERDQLTNRVIAACVTLPLCAFRLAIIGGEDV